MDSRSITSLLILAILAGALFVANRSSSLFTPTQNDTFISPYDVRGMSIVHAGTPYTLNFTQQNECVEALNRALPITNLRAGSAITLPFEKLIIYRFQQSNIELPLADISEGTLIFKAETWNPGGYLAEITGGSLWQMLEQAYQP